MDGPRRWSELVDGQTIRIAGRTPGELADAAAELLADRDLRGALGRRGRRFAESQMGVPRTAQAVKELARGLGVPI